MDWKVTKVDVTGEGSYERAKLFERTIPESRWLSLPPPIRRRESALQAPQKP
jgi:hypothetical protein